MHAWRGDALALPGRAEGLGMHSGFFLTQKSFPTSRMTTLPGFGHHPGFKLGHHPVPLDVADGSPC